MRIAIVNGVNFHFEVLSGLLHLLQRFEAYTDVYLSPFLHTRNFHGAWDLIRWSDATWMRTDDHLNPKRIKKAPYELVILVSPDYELMQTRALLSKLAPKAAIAIMHNGEYEHVTKVMEVAPKVDMMTLSPHVATSLHNSTHLPTNWMLSVYPVPSNATCASTVPEDMTVGACYRGFAMQGKFSNLRRNYSSVWYQVTNRLADIRAPEVAKVFHIHVLGKGRDRLGLPSVLSKHVTVHRRLPYLDFYKVISNTIALVPSLAQDMYFTSKFSSTVMTSLNTGVPLIATERLLKAYTFLKPEAVFLQKEGEEEIDVMLRISRMPAAEILKTRRALAQLRDDLNQRSWGLLDSYVKSACETAQREKPNFQPPPPRDTIPAAPSQLSQLLNTFG